MLKTTSGHKTNHLTVVLMLKSNIAGCLLCSDVIVTSAKLLGVVASCRAAENDCTARPPRVSY